MTRNFTLVIGITPNFISTARRGIFKITDVVLLAMMVQVQVALLLTHSSIPNASIITYVYIWCQIIVRILIAHVSGSIAVDSLQASARCSTAIIFITFM